MRSYGPSARYLVLGCLLVLLGFGIIFAMTIGVVTPTFLLSFAGYGASFAGLMLGIVGAANLVE